MTKQEFAVRVTQVHAAAQAVFEILARGACSGAHPFPVAVGLEAPLPDIHQVVPVDVALVVVGADAGAG